MGTGIGTGMRTGTGLEMQKGIEPGIGTGLEHCRGQGEMGARQEQQDAESCGQCQRGAKPRQAERCL